MDSVSAIGISAECTAGAPALPGGPMHPSPERGTRRFGVKEGSMDAAEVATTLAGLGSATLGESGGRAAHRRLRAAWPGATLAGPAYPVCCTPGDNLAVHVAVTRAQRGSVLCVDVGLVPDRGY